MKTAIIYSGHMRTFRQCVPTHKWHVWREYPDAEFFICTVKDDDSDSAEEIRKYTGLPVHIEVLDAQPDIPEPHEPIRFEPYARSVPVQAVLRQLWQLERTWEFVKTASDTKFDCYIRMRPDSFFHSYSDPFISGYDCAYTPWWGRFGGVNDRFAVLGPHAAEAYFTTYSRIGKLMDAGCPLHPESLVYGSLCMADTPPCYRLSALFSTVKKDGVRPPEILPNDIADINIF